MSWDFVAADPFAAAPKAAAASPATATAAAAAPSSIADTMKRLQDQMAVMQQQLMSLKTKAPVRTPALATPAAPATPTAPALPTLKNSGGIDIELSPLQRQAVRSLQASNMKLLVAPMGFGKTRTMIAAMQELSAQWNRLLIVVPSRLIHDVWCNEMKACGLREPVFVSRLSDAENAFPDDVLCVTHQWLSLQPSAQDCADYNLTTRVGAVSTDSTYRQRLATLIQVFGVDAVVVDEAHSMKNPNSIANQVMRALAHRLKFLYLMSGTPAPNLPCDLWTLTRLLSPELRSMTDLRELTREQSEEHMVYFTSKDLEETVYIPTPFKQYVTYELNLSTSFVKEKAEYLRSMMKELSSRDRDRDRTGVGKLQMFREFADLKQYSLPQEVAGRVVPGKKNVIFFFHHHLMEAMAQELLERGIESRIINSATPQAERTLILSEFETEQAPFDVLILGLGCGGQGLNLQYAEAVHIAELYWHEALVRQAVARVVRRGQKKRAQVFYYAANCSFDRVLLRMAMNKHKLTQGAMPERHERETASEFSGRAATEIALPQDQEAQFGVSAEQLGKRARAAMREASTSAEAEASAAEPVRRVKVEVAEGEEVKGEGEVEEVEESGSEVEVEEVASEVEEEEVEEEVVSKKRGQKLGRKRALMRLMRP